MNLKLKKTISAALTLIMLVSCFGSGMQAFADFEQIVFLEADGSESRVYNPIEINSDTYELVGGEYGTTWYTTGAYVSPNLGRNTAIDHGITVRGDVSLIIRDNLRLSVKGGIYVTENSTLTIYGQSNAPQGMGHYSTGVLSAVATDDAAGIGGKEATAALCRPTAKTARASAAAMTKTAAFSPLPSTAVSWAPQEIAAARASATAKRTKKTTAP